MKVPNVSEQSALGAGLAVFGALGTVLAFGTIAWKDATPILGIMAGSGWMLAAAAVYANSAKARRIKELEADHSKRVERLEVELADQRAQANQWSDTSNNVAQAVNTVMKMQTQTGEVAPPRRVAKPRTAVVAQEAKQAEEGH